MRENNPFDDASTAGDSSSTTDQATANALGALAEPKKSHPKSTSFLSALKGRKSGKDTKKTDIPATPTDAPAEVSAAPTVQPQPSFNDPVLSNQPTEPNNSSDSFKKKPPVAIDGVSPDYNSTPVAAVAPNDTSVYPPTPTQYDQQPAISQQYEDYQPQEQTYAPVQEQPMIYQQPTQQDFYQQNDPYANPLVTNQPLPVNYNTAPNIYDPYNPYATMVDLNPGTPGAAKKPDWKFVITFSIAVICFAGMIFFAIIYTGNNDNYTRAQAEIETLKDKSADGQKAANQVEDYQNTIRDLTTKNQDLKDENDKLKKNEDKVKELETANTTLQTDKQSWMDKYYEALGKCGDRCAGSTGRSSDPPSP